MVHIRPLTNDEAAAVFPRRGQLDISDYIEALRSVSPGEAAEIDLDGLTRRSVKRRMGMAARQLGTTLKWARTFEDEDILIFQVRNGSPAVPKTPRTRRTRVPASV